MITRLSEALLFAACLCLPALGCGGDEDGGDTANGSSSGPTEGPQTPPQGGSKVEAWLSEGHYRSWACEETLHEARMPSPHGFNRICSNDLIAKSAEGTTAWPEGAAAVKELYDSEGDSAPVGYAVYLKTSADSAGGANWYWYERVPQGSAAPHDDAGVVADGLGTGGPEKSICVGCHLGAGSDALHTPTAGGRDQVYTPVH